jgi:hypothetical protein
MPVRSGSVFCQMCRRRDTKPFALPSDRLEFAKIADTIGDTPSAMRIFATMSASDS